MTDSSPTGAFVVSVALGFLVLGLVFYGITTWRRLKRWR